MIYKPRVALLFSCLAAGVLGGQATATKRLYGHSTHVSHAEYNNHYKPATPQYDFTYGVSDLSYGGPSYGASESRRGARTTGSYFVDIPGSQSQKVSYVVGGDPSYEPLVSYQKEYLPKLEKVGYKAKNVNFHEAKGLLYNKSVIKHPSPGRNIYSPKPKLSHSPKRGISHPSFSVSHSSIRNYHTISPPTAYSKFNFFYPKTAVSYSNSLIYHPKPSYTTIYQAYPVELKGENHESGSKEEDSAKKGVTISKLPSTKVTYQPILIKTYKPVYEVKYKPVFKREDHH